MSTIATRIFSFRKQMTASSIVDSSQNAISTDFPLQPFSDLKVSHFSTSTLSM
jgi:hypothetical protein